MGDRTAQRRADLVAAVDTALVNLKVNTAIAAVFVWDMADASAAPGPRQSRTEVEKLIEATSLVNQLRTYNLLDDFTSGKRGRAP